MATDLVRLTNFINRLSFGVHCSKSARNEEPSLRGAFDSGLASGDSGLQLNLEIALSGVSAKVKPFNRFQAGRKCVEASDDVIEKYLTTQCRQPQIGLRSHIRLSAVLVKCLRLR